MSEINEKCLEAFPAWLNTFGEDVSQVLAALKTSGLPEEASKLLTGGINYVFKSLDLVPDGIDDIGYLDDAFVLRLAIKAALEGNMDPVEPDTRAELEKLASDTGLVQELLSEDVFGRLDKYPRALANGAARGRTVDEIVTKPDVFKQFSKEVEDFVGDYSAPSFSKDEKNLIKLKAFLEAKLPK